MKVWILCVLLCAAFTLRTVTAAAVETKPEEDQKLPEGTNDLPVEEVVAAFEDKKEPLEADAAPEVKAGFCPHGWLNYNSRCFRLMKSSMSWITAETQCATDNSRLASVHNIGEHKFLQNLLEIAGVSQAWIGAYYFQGSWLWADTTRFYYSNWQSMNSVSSYPCAFIRNNAGWSNTNCANVNAFFCAIDLNACFRT